MARLQFCGSTQHYYDWIDAERPPRWIRAWRAKVDPDSGWYEQWTVRENGIGAELGSITRSGPYSKVRVKPRRGRMIMLKSTSLCEAVTALVEAS